MSNENEQHDIIDAKQIIEELNECSDKLQNYTFDMDMKVLYQKLKEISNAIAALKTYVNTVKASAAEIQNLINSTKKNLENVTIEYHRINYKDTFQIIKDNLPAGLTGEIISYNVMELRTKTNSDKQGRLLGQVVHDEFDDHNIRVDLYGDDIKIYKTQNFFQSSNTQIYKIVSFINSNLFYRE